MNVRFQRCNEALLNFFLGWGLNITKPSLTS